MKIVRLNNNTVVEIVPSAIPIDKLEWYYNSEFATQCVEAPEEVEQKWTYNNGVWTEPIKEEPQTEEFDLLSRITDLEMAIAALMGGAL